MTDCTVCCETYNKSSRKKVTCPKCDYEICRICMETYLLGTHQDPHCMNCSHAWNREFLDAVSTRKFITGTLKTHRENILFEREKCLLPETQPQVERKILVRQVQQEILKDQERIRLLRIELEDKIVTCERLRYTRVPLDEARQRQFCRKCPVDDCKGFLTSSWNCELCKNKICKDCNEIKCEEHVCSPDNVETTKLLNRDTKPCPSCGTFIFKISGCPQMWCISCHVAFDWNTLRIERGVIHNPHFFDFQRTNSRIQLRNPGDIPCGGRPTWADLSRATTTLQVMPKDNHVCLSNCLRLLNHIEHYALRYEYYMDEPDNLDIRILYMMNETTEESFKRNCQVREKRYRKNQEFRDVITMYMNTCDDLLRQIVTNPIEFSEIMETIHNLREYSNKNFGKIGVRYSCVAPHISINFRDMLKTNAYNHK